jgi:cysteinyl-tRNA synthetase
VDAGLETISEADKKVIEASFQLFIRDILGLRSSDENQHLAFDELMQLVIDIRNDARKNKNFSISDTIRDKLKEMGIVLRDGPDGTFWVHE